MESYQKRVVTERNSLQKKIEALESFQYTEQFRCLGNVDSNLLKDQLFIMKNYRDILDTRINRFDATSN